MQLPEQLSSRIESVVSFVKNADEKTRYYIFGGILIVVLILDYVILMGPQLTRLTKMSGEIKSLSTQIGLTKNNLLRLNQYREDIDRLKSDIKKGQIKIRSNEGVPLILESISRVASNNGVVINQITPKFEGQKSILKNNAKEYFSLPIKIEAKSDYHDFGRFINEIEKGDILFRIESFSILGVQGFKKQTINLILDTIIYASVKSK